LKLVRFGEKGHEKPGVGLGMKPQVFLKNGDTMRLGIDGLGEQAQKVVAR
jgi:2-keto-4-pentenoate hydratase/2-oxohepta-3-ene-1,7-dioic acid hydratase in catechol pathway